MSEQSGWMRCRKCQGLTFAGAPTVGSCFAGGVHDLQGSLQFVVTANVPAATNQQANWQRCIKCQALTLTGVGPVGECPAGESHDHQGSFAYILTLNVAPGANQQSKWMHCQRCRGLSFIADSPGSCVDGASHDHSGSGDYVLSHGANILKLFQIPVSAETDQAKELQSALNDLAAAATQMQSAAQRASDPGHAAIGGAAGQLANDLGKARSTSDAVASANKVKQKVVDNPASLGNKVQEANKRADDLTAAIQRMENSWINAHDVRGVVQAVNDTIDAINALAAL